MAFLHFIILFFFFLPHLILTFHFSFAVHNYSIPWLFYYILFYCYFLSFFSLRHLILTFHFSSAAYIFSITLFYWHLLLPAAKFTLFRCFVTLFMYACFIFSLIHSHLMALKCTHHIFRFNNLLSIIFYKRYIFSLPLWMFTLFPLLATHTKIEAPTAKLHLHHICSRFQSQSLI